MARDLTVDNETFQYPESGDSPGWGGEATDWASKVTEVLDGLKSPDDILQTSYNIANNISSFQNIVGLVFNTSTVRSAFIEYSVYRVTSLNEVAETGVVQIVYKNNAATWELNRQYSGEAGMIFEITDAGQFRYKSSNLAGASYSGIMQFRAKVLKQ